MQLICTAFTMVGDGFLINENKALLCIFQVMRVKNLIIIKTFVCLDAWLPGWHTALQLYKFKFVGSFYACRYLSLNSSYYDMRLCGEGEKGQWRVILIEMCAWTGDGCDGRMLEECKYCSGKQGLIGVKF